MRPDKLYLPYFDIFVSLIFITFFVGFYQFRLPIFDLILNIESSKIYGEPVAEILKFSEEVSFKRSNDIIWGAAEKGVSLYDLDTIKTGLSSNATIKFDGGTEILIGPETMLLIRAPSKLSKFPNLDLFKGNVAVFGGKAKVKLAGKVLTVDNKTAIVASAKPVEVKPQKINIDPAKHLNPEDNKFINYEEESPELTLNWTENPWADYYKIRISRDRLMSNILKEVKIDKNNLIVKGLKPGEFYYWNVEIVSEKLNNKAKSLPTRFALLPKPSNEGPEDEEEFNIKGFENIKIPFSWTESKYIKKYILFISQDDKFNKIALQKIVASNTTEIKEFFGIGEFYWRVGIPMDILSEGKILKKIEYSEPFKFTLKAPMIIAPNIINPMSGMVFKNGATVNATWEKLKGVEKYKIEIASDENFKDVYYNQVISKTSFKLDEIKDGSNYLRVGTMNKGKVLAYSKPVDFLYEKSQAFAGVLEFSNPPVNNIITTQNSFTIEGKAPKGVEVFILNKKINITSKGEFSHKINLEKGINNVLIEMVDPTGKSTYYNKTIVNKGK